MDGQKESFVYIFNKGFVHLFLKEDIDFFLKCFWSVFLSCSSSYSIVHFIIGEGCDSTSLNEYILSQKVHFHLAYSNYEEYSYCGFRNYGLTVFMFELML